MISEVYRAQVLLLIRTLPLVAAEDCFALKGGTAINLFVRDMPRLSVDIDLTYLPVQDRAMSLLTIEGALLRIKGRIEQGIAGARVTESRTRGENALTKLVVATADAQIKIEVTPVLRGTVFAPEVRRVAPKVEATFGLAEIAVVSFADLYAGKLVAALDRQHPRDLFDVRDLLRNEGIDDALRQAFAVYLIGHGRPMAEVLTARPKDITQEFARGFAGMTDELITVPDLVAARLALVHDIVGRMPADHRKLLLSVEAGEPDWSLLPIKGVGALPAVKWRLQNIGTLSEKRRAANVAEFAKVLGE